MPTTVHAHAVRRAHGLRPNPDLQAKEDLAMSAKSEGVSYPELIQRIVNLGINYRVEWDAISP